MKILRNSSAFLLLFLTVMVTLSTVLFFFDISISKLHLITSFIISGVGYYFIIKNRNTKKEYYDSKKKMILKEYCMTLLISLVVIILSTLISTFMFDRSSDGNTYHKDAIGVLKEGFNPVKESSKDFIIERDGNDRLANYSIWTDHYAKANWIMASNFYKLTNNIESGKAMNFISMYIVFGLIFTSLVEVLGFKKSLILSLIVVINPITASQMLTYYNDQLVYLYLMLSIFCLIKIDKNINDKEYWFYYILTFILLFNTKFNGMGYLLVFSFLFVCKYLYKAYKDKEFLKVFKKLCLIFIPLFIVGIVVVGYPTYIKNTIDHGNPVFPLYDKNGEDIITEQQPKSFLKYNTLEKLFYGTFSKANNLRDNDNTDIKIPFTFYKSELKPAMSNDLRISGWGIFFSGLLIVSIGILVVKYKSYKEENFILYTLGITTLLLLVMSESWWARYTPHFYLFILLSSYIILRHGRNKLFKFMFIAIICVNTLIPLLGNSYYTLTNSYKTFKDLYHLKGKSITLNDNNYNGILYNLKDYKIKYKFDNIEGKELYYHYIEYKEN